MSFSSSVKTKLCELNITSPEALHAFVYGFLLFSKDFSFEKISATSETSQTLGYVAKCANKLLGEKISVVRELNSSSKKLFELTFPDSSEKLFRFFKHKKNSPERRIAYDNLSEDTFPFFVRGVFLACGTVSDPNKLYRLEFSTPFMKLSLDLMKLLGEQIYPPLSSVRQKSFILYYKESSAVEDLLTYCGAVKSSLQLMEIKVVKNVRNKINRVTNCETANISKFVNAAVAINKDIALILEKRSIEYLSEDLRELALLRYNNPEMSIRDLGEALDPPLSRSGVAHRLKRISAAAESLK